MKYGLFDYLYGKNKYLMGVNFGDEIQSIAASYFLPRIDCFVDRENIRNANIGSESIKLIMNGWYMHDQDQFPPCKGIIPLFISMCVADGKDKFIKRLYDNREYLCKHGPIGTRDKFTLNIMKKIDVPAYYSGCLTLTLPKKNYVVKRDYILCIDVNERVVERIKKNTNKKVYTISPGFRFPVFTSSEKFEIANNLLTAYQAASCVITSRLHATMPCLALETPVLLLDDSNGQDSRFTEIGDLVRKVNSDFYFNNLDYFDVNFPTSNGSTYLKYRDLLINRCEKFTGQRHRNTSPLFDMREESLEEQNVRQLEVLNSVSDRYRTKDLLLYALKKNLPR